jgi:hypothetical protein
MKNKKAISTLAIILIIVAVILICILVLVVPYLLVRNAVNKVMEDTSDKSDLKMKCTSLTLNIDSDNSFCNLSSSDGPIKLTVQRGADDLGSVKMRVLYLDSQMDFPAPEALKSFPIIQLGKDLQIAKGQEVSITLIPIIGENSLCDPSDTIKLICE